MKIALPIITSLLITVSSLFAEDTTNTANITLDWKKVDVSQASDIYAKMFRL